MVSFFHLLLIDHIMYTAVLSHWPFGRSLALLLLPYAGWAVCQSQVRSMHLLAAGVRQIVTAAYF
jgi:hypothetical protein